MTLSLSFSLRRVKPLEVTASPTSMATMPRWCFVCYLVCFGTGGRKGSSSVSRPSPTQHGRPASQATTQHQRNSIIMTDLCVVIEYNIIMPKL